MNGSLLQLAAAFVAVVFFSVTTQAPRRTLASGGLVGALAWGVQFLLGSGHEVATAFAGALTAGALAEVLARRQREPVTVYISAGILPLVPGVTAYRGMLALVQGDAPTALTLLTQTLFVAGAVAAGVALPTALVRARRRT